jgi:hypothetical protein
VNYRAIAEALDRMAYPERMEIKIVTRSGEEFVRHTHFGPGLAEAEKRHGRTESTEAAVRNEAEKSARLLMREIALKECESAAGTEGP